MSIQTDYYQELVTESLDPELCKKIGNDVRTLAVQVAFYASDKGFPYQEPGSSYYSPVREQVIAYRKIYPYGQEIPHEQMQKASAAFSKIIQECYLDLEECQELVQYISSHPAIIIMDNNEFSHEHPYAAYKTLQSHINPYKASDTDPSHIFSRAKIAQLQSHAHQDTIQVFAISKLAMGALANAIKHYDEISTLKATPPSMEGHCCCVIL